MTAPPATRFPLAALLVLAGAIFVSMTGEFLPTGLLPDMAADLDVSVSQAGILVTVFAVTVLLTTIPLASLTRGFSRKGLVVVVLLVNATATLLAALAPSYELLLGARILAGLCHGLFWAVIGSYAAHLVPKEQLGRAIALTSTGGTAASVLGVPLGTALGHALDWRLAFGVIAVIMLAFALLVLRVLPPIAPSVEGAQGAQLGAVVRDPSFWSVMKVCITIAVVMTGQFAFYTYITPFSIDVVGAPAEVVPGLLLLYGCAGAIGLVISGIVGDRYPMAAIIASIATAVLIVLAIGLFASSMLFFVIALIVWSIALAAIPTLLGTRNMRVASLRVRDLASAGISTFFNFGIAGGSLLGALAIGPIGLEGLPFIAGGLMAAGLAFFVLSHRRELGR
ncbi:MFS transporter [Naasia lichenicola]|uniref:MFS transporter n=1 Tax=Naasia lichenicola TaxID=2565933 RepID=A0A4S4FKH4_9MICO|nr:MFS transporter [Naasia lichenicola]THG29785.1 MFS transporter [Naasia lichenicola]